MNRIAKIYWKLRCLGSWRRTCNQLNINQKINQAEYCIQNEFASIPWYKVSITLWIAEESIVAMMVLFSSSRLLFRLMLGKINLLSSRGVSSLPNSYERLFVKYFALILGWGKAEISYQAFPADAMSLSSDSSACTISTKWKPPILARYEVKPMKYVFILASDVARPIRILCKLK